MKGTAFMFSLHNHNLHSSNTYITEMEHIPFYKSGCVMYSYMANMD